MGRRGDTEKRPFRRVSASPCLRVCSSLRLSMASVLAATTTEFLKLKPLGRRLLVFRRHVVAALAFTTLEDNVVTRHKLNLISFQIANFRLFQISNLRSEIAIYSITSVIVPAPTVRPPSRIAKRNPFSIAIGVINSIDSATLSPGITISTPSGKLATPVTSVVRK